MKIQLTKVVAYAAAAASVISLTGCSHTSSPAQDSAANQNMLKIQTQHTASMDAWRQAHPGQSHPDPGQAN